MFQRITDGGKGGLNRWQLPVSTITFFPGARETFSATVVSVGVSDVDRAQLAKGFPHVLFQKLRKATQHAEGRPQNTIKATDTGQMQAILMGQWMQVRDGADVTSWVVSAPAKVTLDRAPGLDSAFHRARATRYPELITALGLTAAPERVPAATPVASETVAEAELVAAPGGLLAFAQQETKEARKCIVARARAALSAELQDELDFMIESPTYSISVINRALNARGYPMSRASVDHHIKGKCSCSYRVDPTSH